MFSFDTQFNPYPISRKAVFANNGMVATSQSLASQAGLEILKKGGNAIDAAIATAACLAVVEPTSNGIGGDAFAIVWTKGKIHGLNGSGKTPHSLSIEKAKKEGHSEMPKYGWFPVTVPGAPGMWAELSDEMGKLSLEEVLKPAITYAKEGYPVSPTLGKYWKKAFNKFKDIFNDDAFSNWFNTFAPKGRAPEVGEVWSSEEHAKTLQLIAETKADSFYRGELAKKIVSFSNETGGFLSHDDLDSYAPEWIDPVSINYNGYDVWELPPNGQGIIALQALNILKKFDFPEKDSISTYHKQIEAMKLAFADGLEYITDPKWMDTNIPDFFAEEYCEKRSKLIKDLAMSPKPGKLPTSGTVYLATADSEGNMVSFIQSNYMGFGSGLVVPGTGISLQNRGHSFSLNPNHINSLKGSKRTFHTIIPGFLTKNNNPIGPFGVMGGLMMPQGHLQVLMNLINFNLDPQTALDSPRWKWIKGKLIEVEPQFKHHLAIGLENKGHDIKVNLETNSFGRGQIILRNSKTGVMIGGTESRTDGAIASW